MKTPRYTELEGKSRGFYILMAGLVGIILAGLYATSMMHSEGHIITGMTNRIVWGAPHVFAVFLIVAASGALNVASIASVFGRKIYKPLSPLSMLVANTILIGGLAVLILDLGAPQHLLDVPLLEFLYHSEDGEISHSIFGWNMVLYTGFIAIVGVYLWFTIDRKMNRYSKPVSIAAFIWRLIMTTGTGLIFGFLVARPGFDAAILAPMFVVLSFAYGLAFFAIFIVATYKYSNRELGDALVNRLKTLLGIFVAATLYFTITFHLTNLYAAEHGQFEELILFGDNSYSSVFWVGQIFLGAIVPLLIVFIPGSKPKGALVVASILVILGGLSQMYVTIIGGQAAPMEIFPGYVVESVLNEGVLVEYSASIYEILLGIAGFAIAIFAALFAMNILRLTPESLADKDIDPHYSAADEAK